MTGTSIFLRDASRHKAFVSKMTIALAMTGTSIFEGASRHKAFVSKMTIVVVLR
jgi:hypothetical protein